MGARAPVWLRTVAAAGYVTLFRMKDFIEVGCIVKAHGIRGEVCIDYNADSPDLLRGSVYLAPAGPGRAAPKRYSLKNMRMHQGRPLLTLEGVPHRTAAELLRGQRVFIPEDRLPELEPDEIYMSELPGLEVMARGEDGRLGPLGTLTRADIQAGQELWTITTPEGREVLFPATGEFVESIDMDENRVVIAPPPGLLEIYLQS